MDPRYSIVVRAEEAGIGQRKQDTTGSGIINQKDLVRRTPFGGKSFSPLSV
jgi:hypothetical protein